MGMLSLGINDSRPPPPPQDCPVWSSGSRSTTCSSSGLGSCLACDASQGPSAKRQAPSHQGLGALRRRALGVALPATPATGSHTGHDTRRQASLSPWSQGLDGSRARASAPGDDLLRHQEDSRRSTRESSV
jgi:hypothetical protein